MFSYGLLYKDVLVLADQQGLTEISSVQTLDTVERTYQEQWMIGMSGKRVRELRAVNVT